MAHDLKNELRALPAVGALVEAWRKSEGDAPESSLLTHLSRRLVDGERAKILKRERSSAPTLDELMASLKEAITHWHQPGSARLVNGTGIVLHSGLGRALYPKRALDTLADTLRGYNLLEVDREEGARRRRDAYCEELLCELTGAEAALVVNNNAAATMIILSALAKDKEVVVSRSQLIEIGGSYRLPDVFEASGCRLREVGTTNKSYPSDYENVINEETGALMLVHTSNYRIVGFTEHVKLDALVEIGRRHDLPVIDDLGSGCLIDLREYGVHDEPPVPRSVEIGADVVCFSGDKLIGGPQAGIIVGTKKWIERIRKNPMARALRIDKGTCLLLEATLKLYLEPERLREEVPTLRMLSLTPEELEPKARTLEAKLKGAFGDALDVTVADATSELGAGTLPLKEIPTRVVTCAHREIPAGVLAKSLRMATTPIFSRVREERIHFDLRTLQDGDDDLIVAAMSSVLDERKD